MLLPSGGCLVGLAQVMLVGDCGSWEPDWHGEAGGGGGANPTHMGKKVDNPFVSSKL